MLTPGCLGLDPRLGLRPHPNNLKALKFLHSHPISSLMLQTELQRRTRTAYIRRSQRVQERARELKSDVFVKTSFFFPHCNVLENKPSLRTIKRQIPVPAATVKAACIESHCGGNKLYAFIYWLFSQSLPVVKCHSCSKPALCNPFPGVPQGMQGWCQAYTDTPTLAC